MRPRRCICALALVGAIAAGGAAAGGWAVRTRSIDLAPLEAWVRGPDLSLRRVDFVGLAALDARALWESTGVARGTPLIDVDPAAVARAIAAHPRVARARAARVPPDRLVIGVTERIPVAVDAGRLAGIDGDGRRFPVSPQELEQLPRLVGNVEAGIAVVEAAAELDIRAGRVDASDPRAIRVELAEPGPALRVARAPRRELQRWLRLRDSGLVARYAPGEIDLRFPGSAVLSSIQVKGGSDGSR